MQDFIIILFYKFVDIADTASVVLKHKEKCSELGLTGRMIVGDEGINGTFEGLRENIEEYKKFLKSDPSFSDMPIKESAGMGKAFPKLKIKARKEIVTLGAGRFDIKNETATELPASELQKWYENDEDFVVLDLRNDYELQSGQFDKTVNPKLSNFRDLPEKLKELESLKDKKVVAVCTGGIRCEKATCLMKRAGFSNIYQLKDGIHTYIKEYPGEHFKGSLFVFDNRMVTPVVEEQKGEIIGSCIFCGSTTENYCSDDSVRPSKKILCCEDCFKVEGEYLRESVSVV